MLNMFNFHLDLDRSGNIFVRSYHFLSNALKYSSLSNTPEKKKKEKILSFEKSTMEIYHGNFPVHILPYADVSSVSLSSITLTT